MNKTANYQLNRWEKTDKVLMDDFNADNEKIDAAIAKCGNCRVRVSTYVGDGEQTRTFTFERTPALVGIFGPNTYLLAVPYQTVFLCAQIVRPALTTATWEENSITLGSEISSPSEICNIENTLYTMIIFDDISAS